MIWSGERLRSTVEGEPSVRFVVKHGIEVGGRFNTAVEVKAFCAKRLDRQYVIYDQRKIVKRTELKD
jgi:hypothetical protein